MFQENTRNVCKRLKRYTTNLIPPKKPLEYGKLNDYLEVKQTWAIIREA